MKVGRVVLNMPREFDGQDKDKDWIRGRLRERVEQEAGFLWVDPGPPTHVLQIDVGAIESRGEAEISGRPVQVLLRPISSGPEFVAVGRGLPVVDIRVTTLSGFDDAWPVVVAERSLYDATDEQLIAHLSSPDPRTRDFVIRRLGERKSHLAVEPLCRRLTTEERPELVLRMVGALVAIGDERVAEPLIELTRRQDPQFVIQIVFALAEIGGPTAEGYLVTLASGHPMAAVRESAQEALTELQRRQKRNSP